MIIFDDIKVILSELSGADNIELENELKNDLGLDSLQMVTLLIMIDESDMNPFDLVTVSDIVALIEKYIGGKSNEEKD